MQSSKLARGWQQPQLPPFADTSVLHALPQCVFGSSMRALTRASFAVDVNFFFGKKKKGIKLEQARGISAHGQIAAPQDLLGGEKA